MLELRLSTKNPKGCTLRASAPFARLPPGSQKKGRLPSVGPPFGPIVHRTKKIPSNGYPNPAQPVYDMAGRAPLRKGCQANGGTCR